MPRNVTVTFDDGTQHTYQGVPDDATPDQVVARASKEWGIPVANVDGGRPAPAAAPAMAAPAVPQEAPKKPSMLDRMATFAKGAPETALNFATGAVGGLGGGLTYLGTLAATGGNTDAAKAVQESTQQALTYQPRTESGQALSGEVGRLMSLIPEYSDRAGGAVADYTGSPALGAAANVGLQTIPQALLGKGVSAGAGAMVRGTENALANYKPGLYRTPEAQRMIDMGVDLTPGQMNPKGVANAFEQLPSRAHIPVLGGVLSDARSNARQTWQQAVAQRVAAPGAKIAPGDINAMADQAFDSFGPMYDKAKGVTVRPIIRKVTEADGLTTTETIPLRKAFEESIANQAIQADKATRNQTGVWLMNKLTALQKKPGSPGLDSGQLIDLRSDVRAQIRKNAKANDAAKNDSAELLQGAERAITESLKSQLPDEALQALREADAKYGDYKVFEKAVAKAKDAPGGFSPEHLAQAIKESTTETAYARGGGRLRQQAKDAKATLTDGVPATGAIVPAVGGMTALAIKAPLVAAPLAGGATLLSATKTGRRFARGETAVQQWTKNATEALSKKR